MKQTLLLLCVLVTFIAQSQSKIGIINDKDGYVNVRLDKTSKSQILGKIYKDEYFTYFENTNSNWWLIEHKNGEVGYVHKSRITNIQNGYFSNGKLLDKNVMISVRDYFLDLITIKIIQIKPIDGYYEFYCNSIIRTIKENRLIDEIEYRDIQPVGGDYGINFSNKQIEKSLFIASKFGDYQGELITIGTNGKIKTFQGGKYFITDDKKHLISNWDSDLSGLTIFDLEKKQVCFNKELDFYLGNWYSTNGIYYAPVWNGERELDQTYQIDFDNFQLKRSSIKISEGKKIEMTNQACECK